MWEIGRTVKTVLSAVLVLQLLALLALSASPELHHALHSDSDCPDHHCLVTVFAQGQLSGAEMAAVFVCLAVFFVCTVRRPKTAPQLAFQYRYSPSRAPPRF
jgi:hypothetical protein